MRKESVYLVSDEEFVKAIKNSVNTHEALVKMGLSSRGAAYKTFKLRCQKLKIDLSHFVNDKEVRKNSSIIDITAAVNDSFSRQGVLKKLGLNPHTRANITWIDGKIHHNNLDTSHWKGKGHLKGRSHNWTIGKSLDEILVKDSTYSSTSNLKRRLLSENLLEYKCSKCGITDWQGEPLSLQLEHKNGDSLDNRIENLCLLCPNCHSQTDTYGGKNLKTKKCGCGKLIKQNRKNCKNCNIKAKPDNFCSCGKQILSSSKRCRDCHKTILAQLPHKKKIEWPPIQALNNMINELGYSETSRRLGVSDNAIRKHIKI